MSYEKINNTFRTYKTYSYDDALLLLVNRVEEYVNLIADSESKKNYRIQQLKDAIVLLNTTEIEGLDEDLKTILKKYKLI